MASKSKSGVAAPSARGRTLKTAVKKAVKAVKKAAAKASRSAAAGKKAAVKTAAAKATKKPALKKTTKKAAAAKVAAKKGTATKVAPKKATAQKPAARKTTKKAAAQAAKKPAVEKTAKKAAAKKGTPRKAPAKQAAVKKATAKKTTGRKVAPKEPATKKTAARKKSAARTTGPRTSRRRWREAPVVPPGAIPGLSEEDQIRSAKYLPRELPKRLFEEERFLFPESYGVNRVRLLVRDPEWVFAYWDVSAETMKGLARSLGERAFKLSRLTLRVLDPVSGGTTDILLPSGSRWWYIRTDAARRTYRAEIGVTLPSGEFRRLAESNAVVTPRVGPSRERARRRLSYAGAGDLPPEEAAAAGKADRGAGLASEPWTGEGQTAEPGEHGGASESFRPARPGGDARPGASDAFRPGASDTYRR
jgi:hypothetical protein